MLLFRAMFVRYHLCVLHCQIRAGNSNSLAPPQFEINRYPRVCCVCVILICPQHIQSVSVKVVAWGNLTELSNSLATGSTLCLPSWQLASISTSQQWQTTPLPAFRGYQRLGTIQFQRSPLLGAGGLPYIFKCIFSEVWPLLTGEQTSVGAGAGGKQTLRRSQLLLWSVTRPSLLLEVESQRIREGSHRIVRNKNVILSGGLQINPGWQDI